MIFPKAYGVMALPDAPPKVIAGPTSTAAAVVLSKVKRAGATLPRELAFAPLMCVRVNGPVVPMPTWPAEVTTKAAVAVSLTWNFCVGNRVPTPTLPPAITFRPAVPPTESKEEKRFVELAVVEKKDVVVA